MIPFINELITLSIMAFAVGMDAFSVGLGMGMIPLRRKQMFFIGLTVGFFHICMPFFGILMGKLLSETFGTVANYTGGIILIFIGLQMCFSSFKNDDTARFKPVGFGLILFALSVSIDSFSIGLSLGIFGARAVTAILLFGFFSACLTWTGLFFGKKVGGMFGKYSEAFGGSILFFFGLKFLFPL
ncbi:manganese efflux pump MntP family protein [Fervidibacillus halotolerans]|uniref:Putative manganese efflux pump MntP n=1 Tax=Fervidibacillus halotolerans TaxID=2980027 RepID=A0A9E8LZB8_9BACI|nr:manganese efflux pump [Fervidibacillus halotolerans]WAA12187.1 manganese efflux pump MntP family protein [Fervidibacillus halotolerans]